MKTAVITGGNSGIGKATAIGLAKKGYRVIIHGKDVLKTQQAVEEIKTYSNNTQIEYIVADVSLLKGMKELADAIKQKTDTIHTLVLSTGVILPKQIITDDGLEMGFAIQYLSRFAITQLLIKELKNGNAKIVHVGAAVLPGAKLFFDDLALKNNFTMVKAMAQEMFANHLFIQEFSKNYATSTMVMNMADVGYANTNITRNLNFLLRWMVTIIGNTPEKASKNFVFLASDETVNFSGYFLNKPGNSSKKKKIAYDESVSKRLWDKSLELIAPIM
jgi:NAD(P)-dependent dehydrogenase (short-subunit alcohol dehydrogenase family)